MSKLVQPLQAWYVKRDFQTNRAADVVSSSLHLQLCSGPQFLLLQSLKKLWKQLRIMGTWGDPEVQIKAFGTSASSSATWR